MHYHKGTIKNIDPLKWSYSNNIYYRRFYIVLDEGSFCMTDICPQTQTQKGFNNSKRWKGLIIGDYLDGLIKRNETSIDADSPVVRLPKKEQMKLI